MKVVGWTQKEFGFIAREATNLSLSFPSSCWKSNPDPHSRNSSRLGTLALAKDRRVIGTRSGAVADFEISLKGEDIRVPQTPTMVGVFLPPWLVMNAL
jgi:hypothetical protein